MSELPVFDALVVGGGVAGLAAALTLGRANRYAMLLDGGVPRNAPSKTIHNLLGHDGEDREAFYARAHAEISAYEKLYHWDLNAVRIDPVENGFAAVLETGEEVLARTVIFATGIRDILPDAPGFVELWGSRVLHCAYCHGYELRDGAIGIYAHPRDVFTLLEANYSIARQITVFFEEEAPSPEMMARLTVLGIAYATAPVVGLEAHAQGVDVVLATGARKQVSALFIKPGREQRSPLPEQLGCAFYDTGDIAIDAWGRTHVPGIYAVGDAAGHYAQLASAIASGLHAGVAVNIDLNAAILGTHPRT